MKAPPEHAVRDAYVDLIKRSVANYLYLGEERPFDQFRAATHYDLDRGEWKIEPLARPLTLLTRSQLDLVEKAVLAMEEQRVPGDFIEAGVWRGGVIVLLRAMIDAYRLSGRRVVAADSFAGIPKNVRAVNDPVDKWNDRWVASLDEVRTNIARFGLLDDRIEFTVGYFADTLKSLAGRRFALIRLDSDSYDSVETSLDYLYPLLSKGGIVIVDDWHLPGCRMAVRDYRARHGIFDEVHEWDGNSYWVKRQEYGWPRPPSAPPSPQTSS